MTVSAAVVEQAPSPGAGIGRLARQIVDAICQNPAIPRKEQTRQVADTLRGNVRAGDFVARLGGDEFAVVLTHTGPAEGMYRARRLLAMLDQATVDYGNHCFRIEASVGAANYSAESDAKDLLHRADIAMYRQKRSKGLRYTRLAG